MFKLKSKLIVVVMLIFGITAFMSCTKEKTVNTGINEDKIIVLTEENFAEFIEPVNKKFEDNMTFVDEFLYKAEHNKLDKKSMLKMLDILNISVNTNVDNLENANQLNGVYGLIDSQKENLRFKTSKKDCEKLLKIRNAMLDECDRYVIGLDETCGAAVMLAYWWKSRNC